MIFYIKKSANTVKSKLLYRLDEHTFDSDPLSEDSYTSIQVNELQLDIDYNGNILYVWGFCPINLTSETTSIPNNFKSHALQVIAKGEFIPGISKRYNDEHRWPVAINKEYGWICIGNPNVAGVKQIEFAPNCVATFEHQNLIAIWLKPEFCE